MALVSATTGAGLEAVTRISFPRRRLYPNQWNYLSWVARAIREWAVRVGKIRVSPVSHPGVDAKTG